MPDRAEIGVFDRTFRPDKNGYAQLSEKILLIKEIRMNAATSTGAWADIAGHFDFVR